jgi:addiction module HigA family antidote
MASTTRPERTGTSTALRKNEYIPDAVSPPGGTLLDLLEERGLSQADLAARTGRPRKTINEIIQGKAAITPDTALQFERVFGTPAAFWLAREARYQEFVARQREAERLAADIEWLNEIPVKALKKRKLIENTTDKPRLVGQCLQFFGVASVSQYREVYTAPQAQFRQSSAFEVDAGAVSAWLRLGEIEAQKVECQRYDAAGFRRVLIEVRALVQETEPLVFIPELQRRCAAVGVAVVFVREISGCRASGVTRWLTPQKALVQLSLRYKTNDHLWFTFFHEAGHVVLHGKRDVFLEGKAGSSREEEEANLFARDLLIPPADYRRLAMIRPYTHANVQRFAAEINIHPAIVVGRLQHDGLLPRNHLNDLKRGYAWVEDAAS